MDTELGYPVKSNHFDFKILRITSNNKLNIGTNILTTYYLLPLLIKVLDRMTLSLRLSSA